MQAPVLMNGGLWLETCVPPQSTGQQGVPEGHSSHRGRSPEPWCPFDVTGWSVGVSPSRSRSGLFRWCAIGSCKPWAGRGYLLTWFLCLVTVRSLNAQSLMASQAAFQGHARGMTIPVLCPPSQALRGVPDQPQRLDFWWEPGPLY